MTPNTDPLDRLAPLAPWEPDWPDVLDRADQRALRRTRLEDLLTRRRVVVALAVLVAVLVPLAALGAANEWWFLRFGGAPTPVSAPVVVKEGVWSGHPWRLIAYPSSTDGLCFSITPKNAKAEGAGGAMNCAPIAGVPRTTETKATPDMTITYLSGSGDPHLPAYIAGPVIETASTVKIRFATGEILRLPTFSAPASVGHVRFYATQLPADIPASTPGAPQTYIDTLAGLDNDGNVVACLDPSTAVNGVSPLADCT